MVRQRQCHGPTVTDCGFGKLPPLDCTPPGMVADTPVVPAASASINTEVVFDELRSAIGTVTDAPVCAPDFSCTTLMSGTLAVALMPPPPLRATCVVLSTVGVVG